MRLNKNICENLNNKLPAMVGSSKFTFIFKLRFVIEFILSLILTYSLFNLYYLVCYNGIINKKYLILSILVFLILAINIIFNFCIDRKKLSKIFLSFAIPVGMMYIFFLLPYKVPDESSHVYRAYNISKLNIIVDTNIQREKIPIDMQDVEKINSYSDMYGMLHKHTNFYSDEVEVFNTFQTYAPIVYAIPSIAFLIGRMVNLNIIVTIIFARLLNFVLFLILGYFSIKKIPFGKIILFLYLFIPMVMQQATSVSADCFINSFAIMFLAYTLHIKFDNIDFNKKRKIILAILAFCISFTKHIYFPIVFVSVILLFDKRFRKNDKIYICSIMIAVTLIAVLWFLFTNIYVDVREYILQNNVNSMEQLKYILKNPIEFLVTVFRTVFYRGPRYLYEFLGNKLGVLDIKLNNYILSFYLLLLVISPFIERNKYSFSKLEKLWVIVIFIGIYFLVLLGLYMGWTSVGNDIIDGVQGRYFIPIMIIPLLCLVKKDRCMDFKYRDLVGIFCGLAINIYALYEILKFYV